jgi:arginine deiminase
MPEENKINIHVNSEIGDLEAVLIHTPGNEVENMTPQNAERALYSDILSLNVARKEYEQFHSVLKKVAEVFEVGNLLSDILNNETVKEDLLKKVCKDPVDPSLFDELIVKDSQELSKLLIEGVPMDRNSLTKFLSPQRYAVRPLHNFFFMRDAAMAIYDQVMTGKMASKVRERESQIMEAIFRYHPNFSTRTFNPEAKAPSCDKITIEGGDVLVARDDILVIGIGSRTTPAGVDAVVERLKENKKVHHVIVQELPEKGESFIHLDMVFTFLNKNECMVYDPVVLQPNRFKTIHIITDNGNVEIREEKNILESLKSLGWDIEPIHCGGRADVWTQEREQWHSGANFFAIGPGKIIGYSRNQYTVEELNKHGYEVLKAEDVINGSVDLADHEKYIIAIEGSELARGGGGARCMTMPVKRKAIAR